MALVLAVPLGSCSSTGSKKEQTRGQRIAELIRIGEYQEALKLAEKHARARADDPKAQERYRVASIAWLIEQTRRACFEDRDEEALAFVEQAMEIGPDHPVVRMWHDKIYAKLAQNWMDVAGDELAKDDLDGARAAYERVLVYAPGDPRASEALGNVLLRMNHRRGMSSSYYDEGVKLLNDYWLHEALSRFNYSGKYLPDNVRAEKRGTQVEGLLADQRAALAAELERTGQYFAAHNEFRLVLLLDPEHEEAREGLERTRTEAQAAEILRNAEMLVLRGRYDEAEEVLREGMALTEQQADAFEGALAGVEEGRFQRMYDRALTLESDLLFEEAIAAYGELLEQAGYYRDAIARRDTLTSFLTKAADLYARAEAAETDEERLALLRQISVFWPEYKDVEEQIGRLANPR